MPGKVINKKDELLRQGVFRKVCRRMAVPVFLILMGSVGYLNADHEEFYFDSAAGHIIRPEHTGGPIQVLKNYWEGRLNPDAPFTYITFAWNYSFNKAVGLDGFDVTTFLLVNVVIHCLNTCLVYLLIRILLGLVWPQGSPAIWIPLGLAVLFAVHPLHASSIVYIIQRRGTLASLFYLLGVLTYLKVRQPEGFKPESASTKAGGQNKSAQPVSAWPWKRIALAGVIPILFWLSFRCKNMGITLPFAILAIEFCLRASDGAALKRFLYWLIPAGLVGVVGMFVFLWWRGLFDPVTFELGFFGHDVVPWGPWEHFLTQSRVFVHYWKLLFLPLPGWSSIDHAFELSRSLTDYYAYLAIIFNGLVLLLAVVAALKRYTLAAIGIMWFYVVLIPYMVLPQGELLVEYKTYLPSIGLVLILAEGFRRLRYKVPLGVQITVVAVVAGILLTATISRNVIYQSATNLWSDAVKKYPHHHRIQSSYATALLRAGSHQAAIEHYDEAIRLHPQYARAYNNKGIALLQLQQPEAAVQHFRQAVALDPDYPEGRYNFSSALIEVGRYEEAVLQFQELIKGYPDWPNASTQLASVFSKLQQHEAAIEYYLKALEFNPNDYDAVNGLANVYYKQGNTGESVKYYKKAVHLKPGSAVAHNNLALGLARQGATEKAIEHYKKAIQIKPEFPEAHYCLGNAYIKLKNLDGAVEHYREAVRLNPQFVNAWLNLANASTEQGKIDDAIECYREVLRIIPEHPHARKALNDLLAIRQKTIRK
ncbi:MAG: tetratricopeptide repeat protein [Planctomycetota bacterium]